jgi:hypothetical protein
VTEGLARRTHPQFEGPIGKPKAGRRSRFTFIGNDGKRRMHPEAFAVLGKPSAESLRKSIER